MHLPRASQVAVWMVIATGPSCFAATLASSPLPAAPGQEFTICAANLAKRNAHVMLRLFNARTGAIAAEKKMVIAGPGRPHADEPCLTATTEAIAGPGGDFGQTQVVAMAIVKSPRPNISVTASLQVRAAGSTAPAEVIQLGPIQRSGSGRTQLLFVPVSHGK